MHIFDCICTLYYCKFLKICTEDASVWGEICFTDYTVGIQFISTNCCDKQSCILSVVTLDATLLQLNCSD